MCLDSMLGSISGILSDAYADMSESPDGSTTFLARHRTNQILRGVSRA